MSNSHKNRMLVREQLMQLLYQMETQQDYSVKEKDRYLESFLEECHETEYFNRTFSNIVDNKDSIDSLIGEISNNWSFQRILPIDKSILRLAFAEIIYDDTIPDSVSVNEAVELAKKFAGDKSGKFVNGILGKLIREHKEKPTQKIEEQ